MPFLPPSDFPNLGMKPALQVDSLPSEPSGKPLNESRTINQQLTQMAPVVKNLPTNAEDIRDAGLTPGLGRSPGGEHGNSLQYSFLENPMDRGAWWAIVHRVQRIGHD